MIILKSTRELEAMRAAGRVAALVREALKAEIHPGLTTAELDRMAAKGLKAYGAEASFKGYQGYPANICVSLNDEVVHGIPGPRRLKEGDVVSIDLGAYLDGFHGDTAFTMALGEIPDRAKELIATTESSLHRAIALAKPGAYLSDLSAAVEAEAEAHGFGVVRDFVGHGIGRSLHEDPQIPNFGPPGRGPILREGMILALEPMINLGTFRVRVKEDGWTVVTADGSVSAHFEHTVAVAEQPEILTGCPE